MRALSSKIYCFLLLLLGSLLIYCQPNTPNTTTDIAASPFLNLHDSTKFVGAETCRSCHQDIYNSFMRTGMGQSFAPASRQKSAATFKPHSPIFDSENQLYYQPQWRNDSLFIVEFKLLGKDTTFRREQYIRYIIGSGQHTNSHIYEENGYLYQAPITFYTQKGIWDLAPGFEKGANSRFQRIIGLECMTCHNSYPDFVSGSENKYRKVENGIACERCHGAGELHVKEKLANHIVDTAKYADYTIVNPRHLPRDLQMNVCQRCHLQGVAILADEQTFEDFKPGTSLTHVMDVFLPEYDGNQTQFIMASQAHRLTKSLCYQKSEMTCLSCHNPHISVRETPRETFNRKCMQCHNNTASTCSLPDQQRASQANNCSGCHMPTSPSIDIPHVTVTDHYIRRPIPESEKKQVEQFIGLASALRPNPDALTRAKGYLHYYESYSAQSPILDSASYWLQKAESEFNDRKLLAPRVHLAYLQQDYAQIAQLTAKATPSQIRDGWTAYRIGEAYWQQQKDTEARQYFARAVEILPLQLDFLNKLGAAEMKLGDLNASEATFKTILDENPYHISALTNLGFIAVNMGKLSTADSLYQRGLHLNPDYIPLLLNATALALLKQQRDQAKKYIQHILQIFPKHPQALAIAEQLRQGL